MVQTVAETSFLDLSYHDLTPLESRSPLVSEFSHHPIYFAPL
ncbi:hypothetical protein CKA32_001771 [Geitlerinema sp. FC II]|nr:hypothetical protein CKA32_001771 [Geitlerinema sp. FC II]